MRFFKRKPNYRDKAYYWIESKSQSDKNGKEIARFDKEQNCFWLTGSTVRFEPKNIKVIGKPLKYQDTSPRTIREKLLVYVAKHEKKEIPISELKITTAINFVIDEIIKKMQ